MIRQSTRALGFALVWLAGAVVAEAQVPRSSELSPPSPSHIADARALGRTFAQVAAQLSPSVVRITTVQTVASPLAGTPLEHLFQGNGKKFKRQGTGSGVVIDARGYILTNAHVVAEADHVRVTFIDGKTVPGKVVGKDIPTDVAVVRVERVKVVPAKLGDSNRLQVGDWVIAIGNPFGLDHTVTVGVVSAKNRSGFGSGGYEDFLQTDASINPGNSGGPLVNLDGEVIGISSMIAGIGTGIGFAVPSSMAWPIATQLIRHGSVKRAYLGLRMQDMSEELATSLGQGAPRSGALVSQVDPRSPAERAGIRAGDVITGMDGSPVEDGRAVQRGVLSRKAGDRVSVSLWREGDKRRLEAKLAEMPVSETTEDESNGQAPSEDRDKQGGAAQLGFELHTLTAELALRLELPASQKGAVVTDVATGSLADLAGLQAGDVVVEVDRKAVTTAAQAEKLLAAPRAGGHILRVRRGENQLFLPISG